MSIIGSTGTKPISTRYTAGFEGGRLAGELLPLRKCGGATLVVGLVVDKMAFVIEVVVDVGLDGGELLQRLHLPEPQHLFQSTWTACSIGDASPFEPVSCAKRQRVVDFTVQALSLLDEIGSDVAAADLALAVELIKKKDQRGF